jgi:hypothetical protein
MGSAACTDGSRRGSTPLTSGYFVIAPHGRAGSTRSNTIL